MAEAEYIVGATKQRRAIQWPTVELPWHEIADWVIFILTIFILTWVLAAYGEEIWSAIRPIWDGYWRWIVGGIAAFAFQAVVRRSSLLVGVELAIARIFGKEHDPEFIRVRWILIKPRLFLPGWQFGPTEQRIELRCYLKPQLNAFWEFCHRKLGRYRAGEFAAARGSKLETFVITSERPKYSANVLEPKTFILNPEAMKGDDKILVFRYQINPKRWGGDELVVSYRTTDVDNPTTLTEPHIPVRVWTISSTMLAIVLAGVSIWAGVYFAA